MAKNEIPGLTVFPYFDNIRTMETLTAAECESRFIHYPANYGTMDELIACLPKSGKNG